MAKLTSANFDQANSQGSKSPLIILAIDGVSWVLATNTVFTIPKYDDPGLIYDEANVTYDGLVALLSSLQKPLIDRSSSSRSTINQKLEQWDGKASIQTMGLRLVDYQQVITNLASPGFVVQDLLNRKCKVYFGYATNSYPDDFIRIFTGYINRISIGQSFVDLDLTDPSSQRQQTLFSSATTTVATQINPSDTSCALASTAVLYRTITNAKGVADGGVTIGIKIDSEIITFINSAISGNNLTTISRGQYGTVAGTHKVGTQVECFIAFNDTPMRIALKTMLSGWNGPWISSINIRSINDTDNGLTVANSITFASSVNITRDYGMNVGDFITLSASLNGANNATWTIGSIINNGRTVVVLETGILVTETAGLTFQTTLAAFRSQYDVYPTAAGIQMTPDDVLVSQYQYLDQTFLFFNFKIGIIGEESDAKTWIEANLFKPIGAYSLTQQARVSAGLTHPPLARDLTKFITPDNVVDPKSITVDRCMTDRFLYNEVLFNYNYDIVNNVFLSSIRVIDADAQSRLKYVAELDIDVKGLDGSAGSTTILTQRANRILRRYRYAAETINLRTQFGFGNTVDAGDIVILNDTTPPKLSIANTETGMRGIYNRIMEVQNMDLNLSTGVASLTLLSNNGFSLSDRFGVHAPSSKLDPAFTHTTTKIRVIPSGSNAVGMPNAPFPLAEYKKWQAYGGSTIRIHDSTFTNDGSVTFTQDSVDPNIMHLGSALAFTPTSAMFVQVAKYDQTSALINQLIKTTFCHRTSAASIASASSSVAFTLTGGFASRYSSGMIVYVASVDGSRYSPDVKIISVIGNVVTIGAIAVNGSNPNLGFTPHAGDYMLLGGFLDGGVGYRKI